MAYSKTLPEWNAAGTAPPQSLKDTGWEASQKPPAEYFNWQFNLTYLALQELQQLSAEKTYVDQEVQGAKDYTDQQISTIDQFSGDYNDLTNKPSIPDSPDDISAEPAFVKNTAFNKDFGTTSGTVAEGNHNHSELHTHANKSNLDKVDYTGPKSTVDLKGIEDNASNLATHQADETAHVTAEERTAWNEKQDALNADQTRKITFGTEEPTGGSDGDIYFQYE